MNICFSLLGNNYFINIEYSIQSDISMSQWKSGWEAETSRLLTSPIYSSLSYLKSLTVLLVPIIWLITANNSRDIIYQHKKLKKNSINSRLVYLDYESRLLRNLLNLRVVKLKLNAINISPGSDRIFPSLPNKMSWPGEVGERLKPVVC